MAYKKEHLDGLVKLVIEISRQDNEFRDSLIKSIGYSTYEKDSPENSSDISFFRSVLELRGDPSIDFDFVTHKCTHQQLIMDNLSMENIRLDSREVNHQRKFYKFCTYAIFQIENLLNYYYSTEFRDVLSVREFVSNNYKRSEKFTFDSGKNYSKISDISLAFLSSAFCEKYTNKDMRFSFFVADMNKVRNENLHRCSITHNLETAMPNFYKVYKSYTFESITENLKGFVAQVRYQLTNK